MGRERGNSPRLPDAYARAGVRRRGPACGPQLYLTLGVWSSGLLLPALLQPRLVDLDSTQVLLHFTEHTTEKSISNS